MLSNGSASVKNESAPVPTTSRKPEVQRPRAQYLATSMNPLGRGPKREVAADLGVVGEGLKTTSQQISNADQLSPIGPANTAKERAAES